MWPDHRLHLKNPSLGLIIPSNRDARMTDVISLGNTEHMKHKTQDEKMNGVKEEKETKKTDRTRKRETPQKSSEASITVVENMNDVGNLEDGSKEKDGANLTDVTLKQEVWRRQYPASLISTSPRVRRPLIDQHGNINNIKWRFSNKCY